MCVLTSRILVVAFSCAALRCIMKLFCGTERKIDQVGHLSLARKVLTRLDPCHILTCVSKDDLEALTPVTTDMASVVNESFKKEEDSLVTDGRKLDVMGVQRYVNIFIMGRQFPTLVMHQPAEEWKGPDNPPFSMGKFVFQNLAAANPLQVLTTEENTSCDVCPMYFLIRSVACFCVPCHLACLLRHHAVSSLPLHTDFAFL